MKKFLSLVVVSIALFWTSPSIVILVSANEQLPSYLVDRLVFIRPVHSGKCMDQATWNFQNGGNVHQWQCHGGYNQLWILRHVGNNRYIIVNAYSGKCLDESTWSTQNGGNIHQWDCNWGANQLWTFEELDYYWELGGMYRVRNVNSGKCLDVAGASNANGANIQQWSCTLSGHQLWWFSLH